MSKNCEIMTRMKNNYEYRQRVYLTRKIPVIIRIDGKAFHTYTRRLNKPFDEGLISDMNETAIYLCKNIQGAKCAYVQSDEISILLTDYETHDTQAWFDYNVQKITSVSSSLASSKFNQLRMLRQSLLEVYEDADYGREIGKVLWWNEIQDFTLANFDSRVFSIPKEEVSNYFLARQKDAVKNSISSVAQSLYSHKELDGKNQNEQQELIFQKGINWNDFDFGKKRGRFIVKNMYADSRKFFKEDDTYCYFEAGTCIAKKDVTIRSKWEVIETPLSFTNNDFKDWL